MSSNFNFTGPRASGDWTYSGRSWQGLISSNGSGGALDSSYRVLARPEAKYILTYAAGLTGISFLNAASISFASSSNDGNDSKKKYVWFPDSSYSNYFQYAGSVSNNDTPWTFLTQDWTFALFTTTSSYSLPPVSGEEIGLIFRVPATVSGPESTGVLASVKNTTELDAPFDDVFISARLFQQGSLWSWGINNFGQLGISVGGANLDRSIPVTVSQGALYWKQVSSGTYTGFGLTMDGQLSVWGYNIYGLLGINNNNDNGVLYGATLYGGDKTWKTLSDGATEQTAAIKTDGTLWMWGRNETCQLGIGFTGNRSTPITTFAGGNNWKQVSCGWKFSAAVKTDGTLWIWGSNEYSRLGIGTYNYPNPDRVASTPVTTFIGGNDWKSVSCGWAHALAIKNDGSLWSWGLNAYGQCGLGVTTVSFVSIPTRVEQSFTWRTASAGRTHSAGIKSNGSLWTWGRNDFGELGIGATGGISLDPYAVFGQDRVNNFGSSNWKNVSCGYNHTVAIKSDGSLWAWGRNNIGQVGIGNTSVLVSLPTQVTINNGSNNDWRSLSVGPFSNYALVLKYDGTTTSP